METSSSNFPRTYLAHLNPLRQIRRDVAGHFGAERSRHEGGPHIEKGFNEKANKTDLNFWQSIILTITNCADGQLELAFAVALLEELVNAPLRPDIADVPWAARIADVGAFQHNL